MDFEQLKREYFERYDTECYKNDDDTQAMLEMFTRAQNLSDAAKKEFVKAFDCEFALYGEVYLGSKKTAGLKYPNLLEEGASIGLNLVTR